MKISVVIISGFLGAGKTTFIQQLISTYPNRQKLLIIENDFGKENFDGFLLQNEQVRVEELTSGCICCSLSGDFKNALLNLVKDRDIETIIIEPSGVGKLSDIVAICNDDALTPYINIANIITVVDGNNYQLYAENFGEFFMDQLQHSRDILLNYPAPKSNDYSAEIIKAAPHSTIYEDEFAAFSLSAEGVIFPSCTNTSEAFAVDSPDTHASCSCAHEHEGHDHCCCHNHEHEHRYGHEEHHCCHGHEHHHHDSSQNFSHVTVHISATVSKEYIMGRLLELKNQKYGTVLRCKGVVHTSQGNYLVQLTPGVTEVKHTDLTVTPLTIIGEDLKEELIQKLWSIES